MATVTHVTVSFEGRIPTQPYGNIGVQLTWGADLEPGEDPESVTRDLFARVREEVTFAVRPVALAKVRGADQILQSLPASEREKFMAQWGVVQWLQSVVPEAAFASPNGNGGAVDGDTLDNDLTRARR